MKCKQPAEQYFVGGFFGVSYVLPSGLQRKIVQPQVNFGAGAWGVAKGVPRPPRSSDFPQADDIRHIPYATSWRVGQRRVDAQIIGAT